jgi:membrane-associated phospholipid phosphatase
LNYPFALSVALAGSVAIIINMGMVNLLKKSFGRSRPEEEDSDEFRNGGNSMPSGHTAVAFCTASVIATEYNSTLVSILSYGTASAVGFSRLYRNKHWTSDVAAGAVLGIVTGKGCCWLFNKTGLDLAVTVAGSSMGLSKKF